MILPCDKEPTNERGRYAVEESWNDSIDRPSTSTLAREIALVVREDNKEPVGLVGKPSLSQCL